MLEDIIWFMFSHSPLCSVTVLYALCLTGYIPLVEERVKVCKLNLSAASNVNFILAEI